MARAANPKLVGAVVEANGECLINCGLLDVTQPEVGGAARVVGSLPCSLAFGWQGDTGHRRCIRLMTIATARCSCEFFASNVTRYARSLTGYGLSPKASKSAASCSDNRKSGILGRVIWRVVHGKSAMAGWYFWLTPAKEMPS